MTSISSATNPNIGNQYGFQTNQTDQSSQTQGTNGSGQVDPGNGVQGQKGAVPPIVLAIETLVEEFAAALAPTSGGGSEKAHHHHHGHGHSDATSDPSSTTSGSTTSGGTTASGNNKSSDPTTQLENASQLITQLWNTTDGTINQLAKIIIMEAADESREAQQIAQSDTDAAKDQLLDQAATLNKEADQMRSGAAVSLVMTVISSVITIGFAASSLKMNAESVDKLQGIGSKGESEVEGEVTSEGSKIGGDRDGKILDGDNFESVEQKTDTEVKSLENKIEKDLDVGKSEALAIQESQNLGNKASAIGQIGQAISGLTTGLGNFANTMYQADEKDTEAQGDIDAAKAQDLNSQATSAQKIADDLNKLIDQIVDLIKEMADAKAQMMQSMTRV